MGQDAMMRGLEHNAEHGDSFIDPAQFWLQSALWDTLTIFRKLLGFMFVIFGASTAALCSRCSKKRTCCYSLGIRRESEDLEARNKSCTVNHLASISCGISWAQQAPPSCRPALNVNASQQIPGFDLAYNSAITCAFETSAATDISCNGMPVLLGSNGQRESLPRCGEPLCAQEAQCGMNHGDAGVIAQLTNHVTNVGVATASTTYVSYHPPMSVVPPQGCVSASEYV